MAYHELIKNFERIREYMRQFYVYGFKSRTEYEAKSARSYDNERRRIESWLGDYMCFRRDESGKRVFLSVDSRAVPANPLYNAFKAKSFTAGDITFHFYILDLLQEGPLPVSAILDGYAGQFEADESGVRKKLKEYVRLGLLNAEKRGREVWYSRNESAVELTRWQDALAFYSEEDPLGVIGSFLQDKGGSTDPFRFKHHYILHSLDSQILCRILDAMSRRRQLVVRSVSRGGAERECRIFPMKIYISSQGGRQYLLGYHYGQARPVFFRLDYIRTVEEGEEDLSDYTGIFEEFRRHLWGVSAPRTVHRLEMDIRVEEGENFIVDRLYRERRCGQVFQLDAHTYRFAAEVYDPREMLTWIRTFIGRIARLECSDPEVTRQFYADLAEMEALYGGDNDVV